MINLAKAIWTNTVKNNQYIDIRQTFFVGAFEKAVMQICADGDYAAYINGKFVGAGQWRTFPGKKAYDEYDISGFVCKGENVLTITAYHQGIDSSVYCNAEAAAVFAIDVDGKKILSGDNTEVRENPYYKSGDMELITCQLGYSFCYDASLSETDWKKATVLQEYKPIYFKRPVKRLELKNTIAGEVKTQGVLIRDCVGTPAKQIHSDYLSPRKYGEIFDGSILKKQNSGVYFVIDLDENLSGYLTMTVAAAKGTIIDIGYGEHLEDLRVRTEVDGRNFAVRYITGGGRETFTDRFKRLGGRYLEVHITNMTEDITIDEIGLIPAIYPIEREAEFSCGNYLLDKIYKISVKTLKACMHEHYEDCPWREQALYAYDSYVQMMCGYYAFGEYEFARASLWLLAEGQRENGVLELTAPGKAGITIPFFSLAWVMSLEQYVMFSGDVEFGKEMLEKAKKALDFFEVKNGLVINKVSAEYWNFIEWSDGLDGSDAMCDSPINFYYILAVDAYNRLCGYCGEKTYAQDTDKIKERIKEEFYDEDKEIYLTRKGDTRTHKLTQALAVLADMPNTEYLLEVLADENSKLIETTIGMSMFKYDALLKNGVKYADAVLDDIARVYGDMLYSGADTLWETTDGAAAFDNAGSLCHAWSAIPVYVFFKYYVGFKPEKPGFEEYSLSGLKSDKFSGIKAQLLMPGKTKEI